MISKKMLKMGAGFATTATIITPAIAVISCSSWGDRELESTWFDEVVYYYNESKYDAGWGQTILPAIKKYYNIAVNEAVKKGRMSKYIPLNMKGASTEAWAVKKMTDLWGYRDSKSPDIYEDGASDYTTLITRSGTAVFHQFTQASDDAVFSPNEPFKYTNIKDPNTNSVENWFNYLYREPEDANISKILFQKPDPIGYNAPVGNPALYGSGHATEADKMYPNISGSDKKIPVQASMPWYGASFVDYHWNDDPIDLKNEDSYKADYNTRTNNIASGKIWVSNKDFEKSTNVAVDENMILDHVDSTTGHINDDYSKAMMKYNDPLTDIIEYGSDGKPTGTKISRTSLYNSKYDMDMGKTIWAANNAWNRVILAQLFFTYLRGDKGIYGNRQSYMKYDSNGYANAIKDFLHIGQTATLDKDGNPLSPATIAAQATLTGLRSFIFAPTDDDKALTVDQIQEKLKDNPKFGLENQFWRKGQPGKWLGDDKNKMSESIVALNEMMMLPATKEQYSSWIDASQRPVANDNGHINALANMTVPIDFTLPTANVGDMPTLARLNIRGLLGANSEATDANSGHDISNTPDDKHRYHDVIAAQADWLSQFEAVRPETNLKSDEEMYSHLSVYPSPSRFLMDDGDEKDGGFNLATDANKYKSVTTLDGNEIYGLDGKPNLLSPLAVNKVKGDGRSLYFNKRNWEIKDDQKRSDKTYALKIMGALLEGVLNPENVSYSDATQDKEFKAQVDKDEEAFGDAFVIKSGFVPFSKHLINKMNDSLDKQKTQKGRVISELVNAVDKAYVPGNDLDKIPYAGYKDAKRALFYKQNWSIASDYNNFSTYYWWGAWSQLQSGSSFHNKYNPYDVSQNMFDYISGHLKTIEKDKIMEKYGTPNNETIPNLGVGATSTADKYNPDNWGKNDY